MSSGMSATDLVSLLNRLFAKFDEMAKVTSGHSELFTALRVTEMLVDLGYRGQPLE